MKQAPELDLEFSPTMFQAGCSQVQRLTDQFPAQPPRFLTTLQVPCVTQTCDGTDIDS